MPEDIEQTFIFDVRFFHSEQNGDKFESNTKFTVWIKSDTRKSTCDRISFVLLSLRKNGVLEYAKIWTVFCLN